MASWGVAEWLEGLVVDGIISGVGAVLGFVPQMVVFFIFLAFLEACGYMARIASWTVPSVNLGCPENLSFLC